MKRRVAMLLALALTFSSLPATGVMAADTTAQEPVVETVQEDEDALTEETEQEEAEVAEEVTEDSAEGITEEAVEEQEEAVIDEEAVAEDEADEQEDAAEAETVEEAAPAEELEIVEEQIVEEDAKDILEVVDGWDSTHTHYYVNGQMIKGRFKDIGNARYYFDDKGKMATGFRTINGARYYFQDERVAGFSEASRGKMVTGFRTISGTVYYFQNENVANYVAGNLGKSVSGWRTISGRRYYFTDKSVRRTGFITVNDKKYYLVDSRYPSSKYTGMMLTGVRTIDGTGYLFNDKGVMQKGWAKYNGVWGYYDPSTGKAGKTGWKEKDGDWYYMRKNGLATVGWLKLNSESIFYLDKSQGGKMLTGVHKMPSGKIFFFDEDGRRATTEGWKSFGDYTYYTRKDGTVAVNTTINGIQIGADGKVKGSLLDIKAAGYSSQTNYLILVNRGEHKVAVFKGKKNNWTKIKGDWICTIGASATPTPAGEFKTYGPTGRTQYGWMDFQYTSAAFCTGVTAGFFFHTWLYTLGSRGNPYYTHIEDGELGVNHSKSCVRLRPENAEWIRNNIPSGTKVVVYN